MTQSNLIETDKLDNNLSCFIFGIKYILEHICHKCKCESIQSASRWLKVCLALFISFFTVRTAITNCMHTFTFINTCFDTTITNNRGKPS